MLEFMPVVNIPVSLALSSISTASRSYHGSQITSANICFDLVPWENTDLCLVRAFLAVSDLLISNHLLLPDLLP